MVKLVEAYRWWRQAEADFLSAKDSLKTKHYEWACFQSQQSGEKALKAYLYKRGIRAIVTHSLRDLVKVAIRFNKGFSALMDAARYLDTFYIPTRYPNGLPGESTPGEFYTEEDAAKCVRFAGLILREVKKFIRG